uniref:Uncharacterized protein n=1 Tax=viral metagenome TaxID=1070528 RepID=A0A6C0KZ18_9ZZZZ
MCELCFAFAADYVSKPIIQGDILFSHLKCKNLKRNAHLIADLLLRLASVITVTELETADTQARFQTSPLACEKERLCILYNAIVCVCPKFKSEADYIQLTLLDHNVFKNTRDDLSYSMLMGFAHLVLPLIMSIKQIHAEHANIQINQVTTLTHLLEPLVLEKPPGLRIQIPKHVDDPYNGLYD